MARNARAARLECPRRLGRPNGSRCSFCAPIVVGLQRESPSFSSIGVVTSHAGPTTPLHGIKRVANHGEQLIIHEENAIRFWIDGAAMLSPQQTFEDLNHVVPSTDGSIWFITDDGVEQQFQGNRQHFALEDARDIAPVYGGAWVATAQGLVRLASDHSITPVDDAPVTHVAEFRGAVWRMSEDGLLCGPTLNDARCYDLYQSDPYFETYALTADTQGVWVGTSRGLYRVLSDAVGDAN